MIFSNDEFHIILKRRNLEICRHWSFEKNRMLADFYIPRLSNNMNIAEQKNHLGVNCCTENVGPSKNGVNIFFSEILKLEGETLKEILS